MSETPKVEDAVKSMSCLEFVDFAKYLEKRIEELEIELAQHETEDI